MKNILLFTVFIVLGLTSLFGVIIPDNLPVSSVGYFQLAPFQDGLSLYQSQNLQRYYYVFTPFNDYIIDENNTRQNLINKTSEKEKGYSVNLYKRSKWENIFFAIASYLNIVSPSIRYLGPDDISYQSKVNGNKMVIERNLNTNKSINSQISGITMSYYSGDFIYTPDGNLYTYQSQEDINLFKKLFGINFIPEYEELRIPVSGKTVLIMNPNIPGLIKITAGSDQKIWVNRQLRLVEVEQKVSSQKSFINSINLEIVDNSSFAK